MVLVHWRAGRLALETLWAIFWPDKKLQADMVITLSLLKCASPKNGVLYRSTLHLTHKLRVRTILLFLSIMSMMIIMIVMINVIIMIHQSWPWYLGWCKSESTRTNCSVSLGLWIQKWWARNAPIRLILQRRDRWRWRNRKPRSGQPAQRYSPTDSLSSVCIAVFIRVVLLPEPKPLQSRR